MISVAKAVTILAVMLSVLVPGPSKHAAKAANIHPSYVTEEGNAESPYAREDHPFTYDFRTYDPSLDPKFIDEDHNYNQKGLKQAFERYRMSLWEQSQSWKKLCEGNKECKTAATEWYSRQMVNAQDVLTKLQIDDEMNHRVALGGARDRIQQEKEEKTRIEAEKREELDRRNEELGEREEEFSKKKVEFIKRTIADYALDRPGDEILEEIDEFGDDSHKDSPSVVLPPEEFYSLRNSFGIEPGYSTDISSLHPTDAAVLALIPRGKPFPGTSNTHGVDLNGGKAQDSLEVLIGKRDSLQSTVRELIHDWTNDKTPERQARVEEAHRELLYMVKAIHMLKSNDGN